MRISFGQFNIKDLTAAKLRDPEHPQVLSASEIIRRFRPDILSINEMEVRPECPGLFQENFLQKGEDPLFYPYHYMGATNSGVATGLSHPFEQKGFGLFEGQYGIGLFSRFPIITEEIRSFERFPWRGLPVGLSCLGEKVGEVMELFPLFSTNLLDLPVCIEGKVVHAILLHASIPVRGPFNRKRNNDQLIFLREYLRGAELPGVRPFDPSAYFVVMGDLNADPERGEGIREAVTMLLKMDLLQCPAPEGTTFLEGGGVDDPSMNRNGFSLRLDYILPSRGFAVIEHTVFRPDDQDLWKMTRRASDHFFVYVCCELMNE